MPLSRAAHAGRARLTGAELIDALPRSPWRVTAAAVWVLAVAGWVAQDTFAVAGLPVAVGLFAATTVAYGVRGWVSGRAPAA
ncbi:hypothetical protein ACFYQ5_24210 [Streptomyces sp. NPDC005794]|uniref:hypothetical protein n=1 Tax=Streptomyces sp. NPDC005794 TaxID=3364733 RepID=UPI00368D067F